MAGPVLSQPQIIVPMLRPMPLYEYTRLLRILDAAATEMHSLLRSSYRRHCMPRYVSQYWQSAAPPAMVPSRYGLISITFFTEPDAMYEPADARESTAITTPPL